MGIKPLTVYHTSDWHLGRRLYDQHRYEEHKAFLQWLLEQMQKDLVDVLLIAGDIFDTTTPSHRAQELYYRFLCQAVQTGCRHVVITAGNHDSPSFLQAPKEVLRVLNVHVIAEPTDRLEDEVLLLEDTDGKPELIVCAVPFLRDRDVRTVEAGEGFDDKERKLREGIRLHYHKVSAIAQNMQSQMERPVPILAMGHLFTSGGKTVEGDGVRELYVGSIAHVDDEAFPEGIDYLALGHLHVPQKINGKDWMRYSGSPLPMGFGEGGQPKSLCRLRIDSSGLGIETIAIPVFHQLAQLRGSLSQLKHQLKQWIQRDLPVWVEVFYQPEAPSGEISFDHAGDLAAQLEEIVEGSRVEILRLRNMSLAAYTLSASRAQETLDDISEEQVFQRCLDAHQVSQAERAGMIEAFREILHSLVHSDTLAE